jgi:hypothetical protein
MNAIGDVSNEVKNTSGTSPNCYVSEKKYKKNNKTSPYSASFFITLRQMKQLFQNDNN